MPHDVITTTAHADTHLSPPPDRKRKKLMRTALTLREKAVVKSFCEQKVNNCKANGELVPSQEILRREVATQFGWSCGRSTLSKIISMDWKVLRGSYEGGNTPRNPDMKRHRRPLFPAFEADLVKFIFSHLNEEGRNKRMFDALHEPQSTNEHGGTTMLLASTNKGTRASTVNGDQGRPLTEALILEEAHRLKKVHGMSDDMLVLSVGWLARFKHRHCIRLRKPAGRSSNCTLSLHHQLESVAGGCAGLTGSGSPSYIISSLPDTQDACEHEVSHEFAMDATIDTASSSADLLSPSIRQAGNMGQIDEPAQLTLSKRIAPCSAQWYQGAIANSLTINMDLLRQIPDSIRELACSCQGSAIADDKLLLCGFAGLQVAVVGLGSVFEAFLTAALVGAGGFVTCVETNPANVYLAQQAAENFCLVTLGLPVVNMKFIVVECCSTVQFSWSSCAISNELKDAQGKNDIAICNCSNQSLEFPVSKSAMLELAFSLLKVGGELHMTDLVSSRRLSLSECEAVRLAEETNAASEDAASAHECFKHFEQKLLLDAPYIGDLRRLFRALGGNTDVRYVSCNKAEAATIDVVVASLLPSLASANTIRFRRVTFRAFKVQHVEDICEDYGQMAVFNGCNVRDKAADSEEFLLSYELDDNWKFQRGVWVSIDGNTAQILQTSWMQRYFSLSGDCSRHCGPFIGSMNSIHCSPQDAEVTTLESGDTQMSDKVVETTFTEHRLSFSKK